MSGESIPLPRRRRSALKGVVIEYDNYDPADIHTYILNNGKSAYRTLLSVVLLLTVVSLTSAAIYSHHAAVVLPACTALLGCLQISIYMLSITAIKKHFSSDFPYPIFVTALLFLLLSIGTFTSLIRHLWEHFIRPESETYVTLSHATIQPLLIWQGGVVVILAAVVYMLRLLKSSSSRSSIDSRLTSHVILRSDAPTSSITANTSSTSVSSGYGSIPTPHESNRHPLSRRVRMRRSSVGACPEQFVVGARVLSQYGTSDSELWFPATISRVNRDHSYDIIYFDGDIETRKPAHRIEILSHVDQQEHSTVSRNGGAAWHWTVNLAMHLACCALVIAYLLTCLYKKDLFLFRGAVIFTHMVSAIAMGVLGYPSFTAVLHDAIYGIDINILDLGVASVEAITDVSMHSTSSKVKPTELFSL